MVTLQAMFRGDGTLLGAEADLRYSNGRPCMGGGFNSAGWSHSRDNCTSDCGQRLGKTTCYCAINPVPWHRATAAAIIYGDDACVENLGDNGNSIEIYIQVHHVFPGWSIVELASMIVTMVIHMLYWLTRSRKMTIDVRSHWYCHQM